MVLALLLVQQLPDLLLQFELSSAHLLVELFLMFAVLSMSLSLMGDRLLHQVDFVLREGLGVVTLVCFSEGLELVQLFDVFFIGKHLVLEEVDFFLHV